MLLNITHRDQTVDIIDPTTSLGVNIDKYCSWK